MNLKRFVSQKLHFFLIALLLLIGLSMLVSRLFFTVRESLNQKSITQTLEFLDAHPTADSIPALRQLLELKSLTIKQKAEIYYKLSVDLYTRNMIDDFLQVIGATIFYNEETRNIERAIYQYALLAQYYMEIGADSSGYEMILNARRLKNFYRIEDPVIRSQALHTYGRFLLSENDFEDALKAEAQMEEDAALLMQKNRMLGTQYSRRAKTFKAYLLMTQGQTEEAYTIAQEMYEKHYRGDELPNHIMVYDFLLPLFWVHTHYAIRTKQYATAIDYAHEYRTAAKKCDFVMKAVTVMKDVMFALPPSMAEEWNKLNEELATDTDALSQMFLKNYTQLTGARLSGAIDSLQFTAERELAHKRLFGSILLFAVILIFFLLILLFVYSETQIDGLTKLRNRRALNIRVGKLASTGKRYSAIMIDIDNFKRLNDTFGHDFGDEVLRSIAQLLVRAESKNVKCYRYGGEEMVIILEHFDLEHAVKFSEHIRNEISLMQWEKDVHVTASFGLGFEMPDSVKEADENMYVAKQKGKNFTAYKKDGKQYLAERRLDIRSPLPDKQ